MRPDALAHSAGISPDKGPDGIETFEHLLRSGASPNVSMSGTDMSPLILLAQKSVLLVEARAEAVLTDGNTPHWASVAAEGFAALSPEVLSRFASSSSASAFHPVLASESQPMAWWRMMHGMLLLLQLPAVEDYTQIDSTEDSSWNNTLDEIVDV